MARIIKSSSRLKTLTQTHFAADPTVKLGYAQNMQDWEADAPFFIFVPNSTRYDTEGEKADVTMFVGLRDDAEMVQDGVHVLTACTIMREALVLAMEEIGDRLRLVASRAMVEEEATEYRQENYPLIWASVEITVNEPMPIGSRRV